MWLFLFQDIPFQFRKLLWSIKNELGLISKKQVVIKCNGTFLISIVLPEKMYTTWPNANLLKFYLCR
ncbi:hypothetical protein DIU36_22790 [Mucilaginibacter rubeus]|nr:hypothetical protein DIU36_22790 [Mucilaginibacter rubeus]